ncbi:MAG TPA: tripartite tricarboxylate transporter substrate binding protein [Burkholderiales bacterium]|nr:tripartite tricarboxylate transporter substrate binding protein [Burkholderiales bacterium]
MNHATVTLAALLLTLAASGARAGEDAYPDKPIRLIIPFVPGGPSDILSRLVGGKLGENLGQQIIPDNRGSAGGIVGFELAAESTPDGYTMLLAAYSGLTINPYVYKKLPYDPQRDLQPITQLTVGGNVVVVNPAVQAKSVKELIALAKSAPGKLNYASTGAGPLLGTELFKKKTGVDIVNIPYKGTGQALIALLANEVQLMLMNPLVAVPNVKSGKLRALAVTSLDRNPVLPDVPTVAEAALPGYENVTWHSLVFPAKTPRTIVKRMHDEVVKVLNAPEVKNGILAQGLKPVGNTPEQMSALIREESKMYAKLVKDIGFQPM